MNESKSPANSRISCHVSECAFHNDQQNKCSLESITVGCCGPSTHKCECTECDSYRKK